MCSYNSRKQLISFNLLLKVLSEQVANAIEHVGGKEVEETVKFVRMMDKFFDCLNVTNLSSGKHKKKPFQDPYRRLSKGGTNDFHLKVCCYCAQ